MLHVQQSPLLRMTRLGLAAAALLTLPYAATAQTSSPPCYEVIPARPRIEPATPMLVDKCSGRTWLLTRGGRGGYRWPTIDVDGEAPKATDRPATDDKAASKSDGGKKCFSFNDRKFCE
jgi:hypothetical protein